MRTTLNIPEQLMREAQALLSFTSKTDVVVLSLRELIRQRRIDELKSLMGSIELDVDVAQSRRRPPSQRRRPSKGKHPRR